MPEFMLHVHHKGPDIGCQAGSNQGGAQTGLRNLVCEDKTLLRDFWNPFLQTSHTHGRSGSYAQAQTSALDHCCHTCMCPNCRATSAVEGGSSMTYPLLAVTDSADSAVRIRSIFRPSGISTESTRAHTLLPLTCKTYLSSASIIRISRCSRNFCFWNLTLKPNSSWCVQTIQNLDDMLLSAKLRLHQHLSKAWASIAMCMGLAGLFFS